MAITGHNVTMSKRTWSRLPKDVQQVFRDQSAKTAADYLAWVNDYEAKAVDQIKAKGGSYVPFPADELKKWKAASPDFLDTWEKATAAATKDAETAKIVRRLAIGLVLLGSIGMMLSMLICVADVVGTNFLDWLVLGTLAITESTMVLIVFGALAFTQEKRGHIRVEILHGFMSARLKSLADLFTHLLALVFFVLLAWYSFGELSYSWEIQEATMGTIRFPLYP